MNLRILLSNICNLLCNMKTEKDLISWSYCCIIHPVLQCVILGKYQFDNKKLLVMEFIHVGIFNPGKLYEKIGFDRKIISRGNLQSLHLISNIDIPSSG